MLLQGFTEKQVQAMHTLANTLEPFKDFVHYVESNAEAVLHNLNSVPVRHVIQYRYTRATIPSHTCYGIPQSWSLEILI